MIVPVLGVPVEFRVPPALRGEVRAHFGSADDGAGVGTGHEGAPWRSGERGIPRIRLELGGPAARGGDVALRVVTRSTTRLRILGAGIRAAANSADGRAWAVLPPGIGEDREALRHGVLTTLALFLVTARDRLPVHAAVVAAGARALLLSAPGGTGKSTLAYALLRDGAEVLADDAAYLQSAPRLAVWARGTRISLPADAGVRFPELAGLAPTRRADGRERLCVPLPGAGASVVREPAGVCLLGRDPAGAGALRRIDADEAVRTLLSELAPGFDRFADAARAPLLELARRGAWRVALPADATRAAVLVRRVLD